ncbi:hypothetical protein CONCODRAFT_78290 [Conidiobolus coronatus NRRL 28638]|uniref:ATPase inhibitor, mitochondrial n=1 Tax=Conidiobolus coronatus (strain ATCC 28846 / CBS 209.66 / NRRL 28638) TaxID=796925 RepID=A0A137P957_CONC2|nr:hypothetical protein CONCODRAFT_78290 [Conidiobolus coronatus NRRL 28638]|eukprot:KXN71535.1 hypothetical protein CONCODRAFT_78290 [Conidiobolus coronatus NRRL 28638]
MLTTTTTNALRRTASRLPTLSAVRFTQSNAFEEKEKAAENQYIRQQEKAKLDELKKKLAELQKQTEELESSLNKK